MPHAPSAGYDQSDRLPASYAGNRSALGEGGYDAFNPVGDPNPVPGHNYPPPTIDIPGDVPPGDGLSWFRGLPGFAGAPAVNPNAMGAEGGGDVTQVVTVGQGQNVEVLKGMQGMSLLFLVGLLAVVLLIR